LRGKIKIKKNKKIKKNLTLWFSRFLMAGFSALAPQKNGVYRPINNS
jgi:hypothetical protein